ncbi:hypothetical protein B0H17DRAFT_1151496 [Mycena rosella]|uniref:Uncharacterized protein n=1 Tax=Mycena rosella TaxID=1033263 RepID=A0AAD7FGK7_MYCRO|nr:hypothetical protein B0H17DRAFT_1151496 [Mycena rosella]
MTYLHGGDTGVKIKWQTPSALRQGQTGDERPPWIRIFAQYNRRSDLMPRGTSYGKCAQGRGKTEVARNVLLMLAVAPHRIWKFNYTIPGLEIQLEVNHDTVDGARADVSAEVGATSDLNAVTETYYLRKKRVWADTLKEVEKKKP